MNFSDPLPEANYPAIFAAALSAATQRFGALSLRIPIDVQFHQTGPRIQQYNGKAVVLLSEGAKTNILTGTYEIAHEAIHYINGVVQIANGLEEGLAVVFSEDYVLSIMRYNASDNVDSLPKYRKARDLVRSMIGSGPDFAALRSLTNGSLSSDVVTADFLINKFPFLTEEEAAFLAKRDPAFR